MSSDTRRTLLAFASVLALSLAWAAPVAAQAPPACQDCHDVDPAAFEKTVHGALGCTDCHAGAVKEEHSAETTRVDCSTCHQDAVDALAASIHGKPAFTEISGKPACQTCHGPLHQLLPRGDPKSAIHPVRIAATCAQCHASPKIAQKTGLHLIQPLAAFRASVHAKALAQGKHAADCSSCHGGHDILPASDPLSKVNHQKVPETCGECHADIAKAFAQSVHGQAAARGVREAPVCTDCHGEHRILSPREPGSPVFATNVPKMTCGRCHGDLRVSEKFGMAANAVDAFEDSYHGLAGRGGSRTVANCASCHGVHDILPSADPRSHVNKANLAKTCGACHPEAGNRFAIGQVHVMVNQPQHAAVFWVRKIYLWLIWGVIGGMLLHNLLDMRRKMRMPIARPVIPVKERPVRMNAGFRIAHAVLMVSFILLAYTGFALKWPEAWWAAPLAGSLRGSLHRISALVMLGAFAFHFVHIAVNRRARACIRAMWPAKADLRELWERVRWFFDKRRELPHSPVLGYAEKAEYLALLWGTVVMALTGFLLWFENFTLRNFPKWVADLSTVVHFYEAILATLAILVWHFYFVIFDPLVYPMDTAWLNGREAPGRMLERSESTVEPPPAEPVKPVPAADEGDVAPAGG
ncbi:MAG: cytochrome b/b6 domain-containing protein [Thermoanaerobaculia bacterium]